jgi:ADP-ribose pyrophosphatase
MWKILESNELVSTAFFKLRKDRCEMPDGRIMPGYFVMEFSDWSTIVPITKDKKVVMVEQFRHAGGESFLEFPGGTTHPGQNECPREAALRELLEETGYAPSADGEVIDLNPHWPNPAMQNNRMHSFIALGCEKVAEQSLDPYEEMTVKLLEVPEVLELAHKGKVGHSIMLATLFLALPQLQKI